MSRLMLWLIRIAVPRGDREFVIGDTVEEWHRVEQCEGRAAAHRWLRREACRVLLAAPAHRHAAARGRSRQTPGGRPMHSMADNLRDAYRGLRAGRATTALAFLILTIVIAGGTVAFSVVDAVALRPLPFDSPGSLVSISRVSPTGAPMPAAPQDYFSWVDGLTAFEAIGASRGAPSLRLGNRDGEEVRTTAVTGNLFDVLGVRAFAGRLIEPADAHAGRDAIVVLSHALWVRRFDANPSVVGSRVTLVDSRGTATSREIVGVLPRDVMYPMAAGAPDAHLFVPYVATPADRSHDSPGRTYAMWVVGRLVDGVTLDQARADVERVSAAFGTTSDTLRIVPLLDRIVGPARAWLLLALAAVGLVLLIACVNVASLLLSRAAIRVRELATREALGASRARLAGGFLLEGLLLALAAATTAILISIWGVGIARTLLPESLARTSAIALNMRVLAVSLAAATLCGLAFATAPAWLASRSNLIMLTKSGSSAALGGRRSTRSLGAFLVAELAFVSVLLVATTLVITSFVVVTTMDLGFDRRGVMSVDYMKSLQSLPPEAQPAAASAFHRDLLARVRSIPGVASAALLVNALPLSRSSVRYGIVIPGFGETGQDDMLETRMVSPGYFETMGQQIVRGRSFDESDRRGTPLVALINDVAAQRFFAGREPVGEVVTFRGPTTIVGVVRSTRFNGPESDVRPELYTPIDQEPVWGGRTFGNIVVRTDGPATTVAAAVRAGIRPLLDGAEPSQARFLDDLFTQLTAERRFNARVMGSFGLVAIAIAMVGIYGTMAFFVSQQVRTIGVHMALGATPTRVMGTVLRDAGWRVATGVAIGLAGAWTMSNVFAAFVFGLTPTDPRIYLLVAGLIAVVSLVAAFAPALRAARLDPLAALRTE